MAQLSARKLVVDHHLRYCSFPGRVAMATFRRGMLPVS